MNRLTLWLLVALIILPPGISPPATAHELPLGDGKISSTPQVGYLMSCQQQWRRKNAHSGPWIQGDEWNPAEKPTVEGSVSWPDHDIHIVLQGDERIISANGLPDHPTGIFPIQSGDPAYQYDRNPNDIEAQDILLRLPRNPTLAAEPSCVPMGMIGFTTDGDAIFNAVDAAGKDAAAHEVQDSCHGHPERNGQYHFHGPSPCMPNEKTSGLVGYALDGFGIYGMRDATTGRMLHDSDLDACHGTTSVIDWEGKKVSMYHYVLTEEYPYTVGCFRGHVDTTDFKGGQQRQMNGDMRQRQGGQMGRQQDMSMGDQAGNGRLGPRERTERAARILNISPETLRDALGPPPPDLQHAASVLGISVETLRSALGAPPRQGQSREQPRQ